jgi:hypothetical protein
MKSEEACEQMSSSTTASSTFLNNSLSLEQNGTLPLTHKQIGLHQNNMKAGENPCSNISRNPYLQLMSIASSP